ncbi:hypothetical protein [Actinacidiphila sp. ITFR-21]|uniref:hypothetical protein n=1 Tax=Actinacidiphila sp. ITFR-21 TaxID=3075199 RepID=UPI002889B3B3|nr:hypothetical protein [Streptomyces sp. ITFR-21]WNI16827.1 hypothetical protein RLT57_15750 [Streptomyces sp. ITFR-21]
MSVTAEEPDDGGRADRDREPSEDAGAAAEVRTDRPAGEAAYEGNRQRVTGNGFAFMGMARDIYVHAPPEEAGDVVPGPRFREGPYPADEIEDRLRGFVQPPSYPASRDILERGPLLLRGADGTGAGTAAFALLRERFGPSGISGLDPVLDLTRWSPSAARGYVLQGLSPEAADALSGNTLVALADDLRRAGGALVVVVGREQRLPRDTSPWQVPHVPPPAYEVARSLLLSMAEHGTLPAQLLETVLAHLGEPRFTGYLGAGQLPSVAVDVARELRDVALGEQPVEQAVENLRLGGSRAAQETLDAVRGSAEGLAFAAAVALLEYQDRTVIHRFAVGLRERIAERTPRGGVLPAPASGGTGHPDLLGRSFEDRLADVRAKLLPRRVVPVGGGRYWSQPVVFQGSHQAEFLLRRLWWDYDGMDEVIWTVLQDMPYQPGVDLAAGQALGRTLRHSTGPRWLQSLYGFATSDYRWQRRLAAYALGEVAQSPDLSGAVRAQLREWSRRRNVSLRCTVAETCAGSFGLSSPAAALSLLGAVLNGGADELTANLRNAVSFALNVLIEEEANRTAVLDLLTGWLAEPAGSLRRAYAVHAVTSLGVSASTGQFRPGAPRLPLAELVTTQEEGLPALITAALENPAAHGAMAEALTALALSPDTGLRTATSELLAAVSDASAGRPGVVAFLLARYRARTTYQTSERTRP